MNELNKQGNKTKSYTIPAFYNAYLKGIDPDTIYDIPYDKYRCIIVDFFKYLRDQLLEQSKEIKLPYRMGSLCIIKSRPKYMDKRSLCIDYQACRKYGKLILHENEHSDGFKYRAYWSKTDVVLPNKSKYQLILTRHNKRQLAQYIKQKVHDYQEVY